MNIKTTVTLIDLNKIIVECDTRDVDATFAFYLYKDGEIIEKTKYSNSSKYIYWASFPGEYRVKIFALDHTQEKQTFFSDSIIIQEKNNNEIKTESQEKKVTTIESICTIAKEILMNRKRIFRLAKYDFLSQNKDSYLGRVWIILNPLIQIAVYWFVFGIGIRGGKPVDGHEFLPWMLAGLIPWFFMSAGISRGSSSIFSRVSTMLTLNYPISTVPLGSVLVAFFEHVATIFILIITVISYGYYPHITWMNIIYYWFCELFFVLSISLMLSVLTMIARDFKKLIPSVLRLWFYMTPILWTIDALPAIIQKILKMNPAYYIVTGFRESLLYNKMFYEDIRAMVMFWGICGVLFIIGCRAQVQFRDNFIDML